MLKNIWWVNKPSYHNDIDITDPCFPDEGTEAQNCETTCTNSPPSPALWTIQSHYSFSIALQRPPFGNVSSINDKQRTFLPSSSLTEPYILFMSSLLPHWAYIHWVNLTLLSTCDKLDRSEVIYPLLPLISSEMGMRNEKLAKEFWEACLLFWQNFYQSCSWAFWMQVKKQVTPKRNKQHDESYGHQSGKNLSPWWHQ